MQKDPRIYDLINLIFKHNFGIFHRETVRTEENRKPERKSIRSRSLKLNHHKGKALEKRRKAELNRELCADSRMKADSCTQTDTDEKEREEIQRERGREKVYAIILAA